jgi:hypothetical protein
MLLLSLAFYLLIGSQLEEVSKICGMAKFSISIKFNLKTIYHILLRILILNAATLSFAGILFYTKMWLINPFQAYFNHSLVTAQVISNITYIVGSSLILLDQKWFPEKQKPQKHKEAYLISSFVIGAAFLMVWFISHVIWSFQV